MAQLIPAIGSVTRRMTPGERRFAQRLESHLEDDYLCWYDVPVRSGNVHPDFIVLNPRRGLLVLEVKDWKLETIVRMDKQTATIRTDRGEKSVANPLEQSRQYCFEVLRLLERDPALVHPPGDKLAGKMMFPWGHGVVLAGITRRQLNAAGPEVAMVLPPERVICQDEMVESADPEEFQNRLWGMFGVVFRCLLSAPQVDRVRWHLFPELRVEPQQGALALLGASDAPETDSIPDLVRVMDIQQEQLARSLGEGHRVIHGVAGSGKTMILGYRAQHLAKLTAKPVLALCFNVALAAKLGHVIATRELAERVAVKSFHAWCSEQLRLYQVPMPAGEGAERWKLMVQAVIDGVEKGQIPRAQYGAVLIDEGHDFEPEWLRLVAQMVDPDTNSLLVLYDDAQSLYGGTKRRAFSFASVGIEARGRTTILRLNYRNTSEVLRVAYEFAREVLTPAEAEEDGVPLVCPESAGRHGPVPELIGFRNFGAEVAFAVKRLRELHEAGIAWRDMAVAYRFKFVGERMTAALEAAGIPVDWLGRTAGSRRYSPEADSVKVMTMHASKGLEFPVVLIPGVGYLPHKNEDPAAEARLLYVAMTRAMDRLVMTHHEESGFAVRLRQAVGRAA